MNEDVVNYKEKIDELEVRIQKLEKIEKDRKTRKIIFICIKLVFYIGIIVALFLLFRKIMPVYDQINDLKNTFYGGSSNGGGLGNFDLNNYFQGLFN